MKEKLNRDLLDIRKIDGPINPIEIIKTIVSNPVSSFILSFVSYIVFLNSTSI
jgi:hypothetical protein